jgi:hypothetical protein
VRLLRGHSHSTRCLAYSSDGRTLASGGDKGIVISDVDPD